MLDGPFLKAGGGGNVWGCAWPGGPRESQEQRCIFGLVCVTKGNSESFAILVWLKTKERGWGYGRFSPLIQNKSKMLTELGLRQVLVFGQMPFWYVLF